MLFQDEARFGRIALPRACWAPRPFRPKVERSIVREFVYVYSSVNPQDGTMVWAISDKMNTFKMNAFLEQISKKYSGDHILLVTDGASSHKSKDLKIPQNIELLILPPYSPELNPTEYLWDELREKFFTNIVFDSLEAVCSRIKEGMMHYEKHSNIIKSLTGWEWILDSL